MRTFFKDSGPGYRLWEALNFVDDARCWVTALQRGTRFQQQQGKFVWTREAQEEDDSSGISPEDLTFREVLAALKSISSHLDFTTEKPADFGDQWVPTLDFKIGQDFPANQYVHNYF